MAKRTAEKAIADRAFEQARQEMVEAVAKFVEAKLAGGRHFAQVEGELYQLVLGAMRQEVLGASGKDDPAQATDRRATGALDRGTGETAKKPRQRSRAPRQPAQFTKRQGQYLAFIHGYTQLHGCSPAQADIQRHFKVSPPSVHQMVLTLERRGLLRRIPGQARSLEVLVASEELPPLR